MDRILAISDRSNAGMHALALAASRGGAIASKEAARILCVSPSYLGKILQSLAKSGLLSSTRGAAGGFCLERSPDTISCAEIVEALDGPLPHRACLFPEAVCAKKGCPFALLCGATEKRLVELLSSTSIAKLACYFASPGEKPRRALKDSARASKQTTSKRARTRKAR